MPEAVYQVCIILSPIVASITSAILVIFHSQNKGRWEHLHECVEEVKTKVARVEGHLGIGIDK